MSKVHLNETQFDGWLHAACYSLSALPTDARIVDSDAFEAVPRKKVCRRCERIWWPHGRPHDEEVQS